MVWGAFSGFNKCPLINIPSNRKRTSNFVTLINERSLSKFYFLHDHPRQLTLIAKGIPILLNLLPFQWRQAHGVRNLICSLQTLQA